MIELDEQLQELASRVELPVTDPRADLARGRTRLRRRNLGAAAAAVAMTAAIGTGAALIGAAGGDPGAGPDPAGRPATSSSPDQRGATGLGEQRAASRQSVIQQQQQQLRARAMHISPALAGYRDILRQDLDPAGKRIQTTAITNEQGAIANPQAGDSMLGTKLAWNGGGMLEIAVGRSLLDVQFFCDGRCTHRSVVGATKALVLTSSGTISVAVFQDDGDIVALTADTSFGNNGTSTSSLGLTVDQLLAAAADPRLDLP